MIKRQPYRNDPFDCVCSCFVLHHLKDIDQKWRTLRDVRRVLKPGELALLDFARPTETGALSRWLHSSPRLEDNTELRMLSLIAPSGFADGRTGRRSKFAGIFHTAYYQATMPQEENHA
jgi:ubiquinone/menaquinone biosynthesis C-methylase UbiE